MTEIPTRPALEEPLRVVLPIPTGGDDLPAEKRETYIRSHLRGRYGYETTHLTRLPDQNYLVLSDGSRLVLPEGFTLMAYEASEIRELSSPTERQVAAREGLRPHD